jgi:serine/threonine protein kinase
MIESYCGTPLNMAPEILEKKIYNNKVDIWSLGVILFELVTGSPPFKAQTKSELKINIKAGDFKVPKEYHVSLECLDFINKCLQYDSSKRLSLGLLATHPFIYDEMNISK